MNLINYLRIRSVNGFVCPYWFLPDLTILKLRTDGGILSLSGIEPKALLVADDAESMITINNESAIKLSALGIFHLHNFITFKNISGSVVKLLISLLINFHFHV